MAKCICFNRVSTVSQDLKQQEEQVYQECLNDGYTAENIIVISYHESGIKLSEEERKGIQDLKNYINSDPEIKCVYCYEISRLSRKPKMLYDIRDFLLEKQIQLIVLKPYMRLLEDGKISQTANLLFSIFSSLAETEMMVVKERLLRGKLAKRDRGIFVGGNILFGYTFDKKTLQINVDEDKAKIVREFFNRYAAGESVRNIMIDLTDRHELPYNNYSTAIVTGRQMLKRSEYCGIKKDSYLYPPIITEELFNKVREIASARNKYKYRISEWYWCRGIIYWKENNCLMSPEKYHTLYHHWDERLQKGFNINMNTIDSIVFQSVKDYRKKINKKESKKHIDDLLEKIQQNHRKVQQATREIDNIKIKKERVNERYVNGKMTSEQADRLINDLSQQEKQLNLNIFRWNIECGKFGDQIEKIDKGIEIDYDTLTDKQVYDLIREYINKIVISKGYKDRDKVAEIIFNDTTTVTYYIEQKGNYPKEIYRDGKPYYIKIIRRFKAKR